MIATVFRIVLQRAQPLEGLFIGTISDLADVEAQDAETAEAPEAVAATTTDKE